MKIFTIQRGKSTEGAVIETLKLAGAGVEIPALIIGEEGRGRKRGILPVDLLPETQAAWKAGEKVVIKFAKLGETRVGKPKLIETAAPSGNHAVVVFRAHMGYRGGNSFSGGTETLEMWQPVKQAGALRHQNSHGVTMAKMKYSDVVSCPEWKPEIGSDNTATTEWHREREQWEAENKKVWRRGDDFSRGFLATQDQKSAWVEAAKTATPEQLASMIPVEGLRGEKPGSLWEPTSDKRVIPWPLQDLATGVIAEGMAGRMGSGEQKISIMRPGDICRISYYGRLYGAPNAHNVDYDGNTVKILTDQEMELL